ncbi:MAG: hypothetical protein WC869_00850 [Phycisphaerae bacterium]|jgi:hypothetical protein
MPFLKHVFKYQEYRRTQFLNTMAKDDLGRHRGGVLYGMKLIPKGTSIYVDAGALYTPYGTKIFWDARATDLGPSIGVVDLTAVLLNGVPVLQNTADRPIVVAVVAQFPSDMETASNTQPRIESSSDLTGAVPPVTFSAFAATYRQDTARPGFNLFAHHPVEMAASGVAGWSAADAGDSDQALRTADSSVDPVTAGNIRPASTPGTLAAVQANQILVGYVILGGTAAGGDPLDLGTDVWAAGVTYVPVMNPWQTLQSLLGMDPLMGRTAGLVDGGVSDALDPTTGALSQTAIARKMANAAGFSGSPMGVPRFGTPAVTITGFDPTGGTYRFPNFLKDGESLLDSMRRMDYMLRLWMDKTGDQGLVRSAQDGVVSGPTTYLKRFAGLEGILYQMDGLPTGNNLNTSNWGADDDLPLNIGSDPFAVSVATSVDNDTVYSHVLKSGVMLHKPAQLDILTMQGAGDSHRQAIRALDWSMFHFLHDIMGVDIRRSWLRLQGAWTGSQPLPNWTDLPDGLPVDNTGQPNVQSSFPLRPTIFVNGALSGMVASDFNIYLGTEKMKAAIETAAKRTAENAGPNLLKNSIFAKTGPFANPGSPVNWLIDAATTWQLIPNTGGDGTARRLVATLHDYCRQYINLTANPELLGAILDSGVLSVSVSLAQMTAGVLYVGVKLLDGAAPGVGVNDLLTVGGYVRQTGTTEANGYTNFTFSLKFPAMRNSDGTTTAARTALLAAVKGIGIEVINPDGGGSPKSISIAGVHLGAGMPPMLPMANQDYYEFLSRDGGVESRMRGPLEMGNHDINDAHDVNVNNDLTVQGDTVLESGAAMNNHPITQVADPTNPTDGDNLESRDAAIEAARAETVTPENTSYYDSNGNLAQRVGADPAPPLASVPGSNYYSPSGQLLGASIKIVLQGGAIRYVPSSGNKFGVCHNNCHSNCHSDHSDCGSGSW